MSNLMQFGVAIYIFLIGCIGLIGVTVIGFGFYVAVNRLIDWYQGKQRKPMATAMSLRELREKRQERAAAKRLQIRINTWSVK
jgi:hypothetical protein